MQEDITFQGINSKLKNAGNHITRLKDELIAFSNTRPIEVATRQRTDTHAWEYYAKKLDSVPLTISACFGDALHNMRAALDHLAWQLVLVSGTTQPTAKTQFPIFEDSDRYHKEKVKQLRGVSQEILNLVDSVQPYKDGNRALWVAHKLNNIDKHRALLTTGSACPSSNLGAYSVALSQKEQPEVWKGVDPLSVSAFFKLTAASQNESNKLLGLDDFGKPTTIDEVLFTGPPGEVVATFLQFKYYVIVHEPDVISATPLLPLIERLFQIVIQTIKVFEPVFPPNR